MKAMTIEEIKNKKDEEWLFIVDLKNEKESSYYKFNRVERCFIVFYEQDESFCPKCFLIDDYGKNWVAYKNKEEAECKGELVELPNGWLDVLKLITCAAICYKTIDNIIIEDMQNSKELGELFLKIPRVQGSSLVWSLEELANSNLNCNKIKCFEDILNVMPRFKDILDKQAEQKLKELTGKK